MTYRWFSITLAGAAILAPLPAFAQTEKAWTAPRTPDGHSRFYKASGPTKPSPPWNVPRISEPSVSLLRKRPKRTRRPLSSETIRIIAAGASADVLNAYNAFWWDSGTKVLRNMADVDYHRSAGRQNPSTDATSAGAVAGSRAEAVKVALPASRLRITNGGQPGPADKAEDLDLMTRCISFGTVVPMLPSAYNNDYQIVQAPGVVAIDTEMVP